MAEAEVREWCILSGGPFDGTRLELLTIERDWVDLVERVHAYRVTDEKNQRGDRVYRFDGTRSFDRSSGELVTRRTDASAELGQAVAGDELEAVRDRIRDVIVDGITNTTGRNIVGQAEIILRQLETAGIAAELVALGRAVAGGPETNTADPGVPSRPIGE